MTEMTHNANLKQTANIGLGFTTNQILLGMYLFPGQTVAEIFVRGGKDTPDTNNNSIRSTITNNTNKYYVWLDTPTVRKISGAGRPSKRVGLSRSGEEKLIKSLATFCAILEYSQAIRDKKVLEQVPECPEQNVILYLAILQYLNVSEGHEKQIGSQINVHFRSTNIVTYMRDYNKHGLVEVVDTNTTGRPGRPSKTYRVTEKGNELLTLGLGMICSLVKMFPEDRQIATSKEEHGVEISKEAQAHLLFSEVSQELKHKHKETNTGA